MSFFSRRIAARTTSRGHPRGGRRCGSRTRSGVGGHRPADGGVGQSGELHAVAGRGRRPAEADRRRHRGLRQHRRRGRSLHAADPGRHDVHPQQPGAVRRRRRPGPGAGAQPEQPGVGGRRQRWLDLRRRSVHRDRWHHQAQHRADQRIDGQVDPGFTSAVRGRVNVLVVANGRLLRRRQLPSEAGRAEPRDRRQHRHFNLASPTSSPNSWGSVTILGMAVNPQGTRLVATGNFRQVAGQARSRLFVANISGAQATLDPWYYPRFASAVQLDPPAPDRLPAGRRLLADRQPLLGGGDRPDPAVEATGTRRCCDGVGRFAMSDDNAAAVDQLHRRRQRLGGVRHGAAVYAQGHFQWLDNPFGFASQDVRRRRRRLGHRRHQPDHRLALPWTPAKRAPIGGRAAGRDEAGLWVG